MRLQRKGLVGYSPMRSFCNDNHFTWTHKCWFFVSGNVTEHLSLPTAFVTNYALDPMIGFLVN